jgi:hypothetical protein
LRRKNARTGCKASSLQRGKLGIVEIALSSEYASVRDSRRGDAKSAWREMRLCLVATTSVSLRVTRRERQQPACARASHRRRQIAQLGCPSNRQRPPAAAQRRPTGLADFRRAGHPTWQRPPIPIS